MTTIGDVTRPTTATAQTRVGIRERWDRIGRPPRIAGLDLARAIAIIGMVGAHVGLSDNLLVWSDPSTWDTLVHGRSSLLFALLAGVSVVLATGAKAELQGNALARARLSLVGRGIAIFAIGVVIEMLGTPVSVILTFYGVLFVVACFFLTWSARRLLIAAGVLAVVGPPLLAAVTAISLESQGPGTSLTLTGTYPLTVWLAFLFLGMGLARLDIRRDGLALKLVAVGVVLAISGYGLGHLAQIGVFGSTVEQATAVASTSYDAAELQELKASFEAKRDAPSSILDPSDASGTAFGSDSSIGAGTDRSYWERLRSDYPWDTIPAAALLSAPHSGGIPEIIGSGGFVMTVLGLCLLIGRRARRFLVPLTALGSMPLTAYSAHVVAIMVMSGGPGGFSMDYGYDRWGWLSFGLVIGCTAWALAFGRGPLERLTARSARAMARAVPGPE